MDTLPEPPPSYEQVIIQKLVACGLSARGLEVSYEDDLQSYEIIIRASANVAPEMFACIREASAGEIVTFDDQELRNSYYAFVEEALDPEMVASAEAELSKLGLLKGFPSRADFVSDTLFVEALEKHCGFQRGEAFHPLGDAFAIQLPPGILSDFQEFKDRYSCLFAAIKLASARGEGKFGFVGNSPAP
ncbi:hypothetical protein M2333_002827 [Sphingobium sp. B11D3B]|uniref:hypothetical protein n=1 Tax=Sphingobium sp. B11D3B TaxID=2940575 RepID=UPI002225EF59|nr:hypothetical protein [Sphingobium sp. B11D3B]MCW2389781.1 hypothetical protein [Sphingobium sp. B11D3B]